MKSSIHTDERGSFQELSKSNDGLPQIKQVSLLTINPGKSRGNHYHKKIWESFIVSKGIAEFVLENVEYGEKTTITRAAGEGEVVVSPLTNHTIYSEEGCEIIILSTKLFDPNDQDTFRLNEE